MIDVSIIIPIYNVENYIEECLQSVLNQTKTDGVECILVDDCGKDNSFDIAEKIAASYTGNIKIKYIRHEKNKGLSVARNNGVSAAEGKYVFFLDSDDYIKSDSIESLWNYALKYPEADFVDGVSFSKLETQNEDFHLCITKHHLPEYSDDIDFIRRENILNHYHIHVTNKLIKKEFLIKNNIVFLERIYFEDFLWLLECARKMKSIALLPKDTYFYRHNENSIMNTINPKYIDSVAKISDYVLKTISLDKFFKMELFKIIEFIHIYDVRIGICPLTAMEFGKSKIFSSLYRRMYADNSLPNKIMKEILIVLFKLRARFFNS